MNPPETIPELEELIDDLDREIDDAETWASVSPANYAALRVQRTKAAAKLDELRSAGAPGPEPRPYSKSRDVRVWARARGLEVPEQGRVPKSLQAAYDAAHAPSDE